MKYHEINFGILKAIVIPPLKYIYGLDVEGRENLKLVKCGAIIASNHLSYLDPILIPAALYKQIHFISRSLNPSLDNFLENIGQIVLNGTSMDKDSLKKAREVLHDRGYLGIFPEGIRSFDGKLGEFKEGFATLAYKEQAPIIPLAISGTYEAWPRHKKFPSAYRNVKVKVGKPIYPPPYDFKNKREVIDRLAKMTRDEIEKMLLYPIFFKLLP